MRRLVCAFVVCKPEKTGFLASRPMWRIKNLGNKRQDLSRKQRDDITFAAWALDKGYVNQSNMLSGFRSKIAEYTVENFRHYPIWCGDLFPSCIIFRLDNVKNVLQYTLQFNYHDLIHRSQLTRYLSVLLLWPFSMHECTLNNQVLSIYQMTKPLSFFSSWFS